MSELIPVRTLDPSNNDLASVDTPVVDATRHNEAVRLVKGHYQRLRRWLSGPLILLFLIAPWLEINGAPLLWMNLEDHTLHLFGLQFWPDDLLMLTWLALASAFALFIAANLAGRIWCGFSCPQTVWSMMFMWVEDRFLGSRNKRLKEAKLPWRQRNLKGLFMTHLLWWSMAFVTGFTFVAYFETGQGLAQNIISGDISIAVTFWLIFFSALTYINAGWLREQVCMHMCPYARFQSVMVDRDTLKVGYDIDRGEPRSSKVKNKPSSKTSGDCIDCRLCVQVCPVGIDIRQGLQYSCIDCGACIDACDNIMDSINKPKGLIRFMPDSGQSHQVRSRLRLVGYSLALFVSIILFALQVLSKESFETSVNRERGQLYFYSGLNIANGYTFSLQNKLNQDVQANIEVLQPSDLTIKMNQPISVSAGEKRDFPFTLLCQQPCALDRKTNIDLKININGETFSLDNHFFNPDH
ncbi:cytochrome c oxidase accessory protein CcoG [Bermanella marisrubri]|uniref:Polyferredoxin n=1 Tax=Bermanella marisrubri TaxID=207949 RepID=Q1N5U8_9GAMM|nr:cytochrome c oxidase accessory protein CcoG [Bermanella marisrubri]EAT13844.1 Polyferredoxin [Oceanobacter sp. RED65] [Bermanella marisrubri]QIZ84606.1 cytochrome c oxidase accessory protein CcoG [Bermanella marisrubri]